LNRISDTDLLSNLRNRRNLDESIQTLYRDYFESLAAYVMHHHGNRQDAEDVFQEVIITFLNILHKDTFREASGIKTFLYSINKHVWLNELKKRRLTLLREEKFAELQESMVADTSSRTDKKMIREEVEKLMSELGEPCRKLVTLYYYEGVSSYELVKYFDYANEQVIRNKLCRCQKKLSHLLLENPHLKKYLKTLLQEEKLAYPV